MGISTHVLNTALGRPAAGIAVALDRLEAVGWDTLTELCTDQDGRAGSLLQRELPPPAGTYRLRFATAPYFAALGIATLYPEIEIRFQVLPGESHYHLPLLLTPNSYTTYRGS